MLNGSSSLVIVCRAVLDSLTRINLLVIMESEMELSDIEENTYDLSESVSSFKPDSDENSSESETVLEHEIVENINKTKEKKLKQTTFDKVSFYGNNKQNTIRKCNEPNVGETSVSSVSQRDKQYIPKSRSDVRNVICGVRNVVADRNEKISAKKEPGMPCKPVHLSKLPKVSKKRGNTSKTSEEIKKKRVVASEISELELSSECDGNLDDIIINEFGDSLVGDGVDQIGSGTSVIKSVKSKKSPQKRVPKKPKRPRNVKKWSWVWNYFKYVKHEDDTENKGHVECQQCGHAQNYQSQTTNMASHMRTKHGDILAGKANCSSSGDPPVLRTVPRMVGNLSVASELELSLECNGNLDNINESGDSSDDTVCL